MTNFNKDKTKYQVDNYLQEKKVTSKKINARYLAQVYKKIGDSEGDVLENDFKNKWYRKSNLVYHCGDELIFSKKDTNDFVTLKKANFCKDRLCPMCAWRRSVKNYAQISLVSDFLLKKGYIPLFVTLTIENLEIFELSKGFDILFKGLHTMNKSKRWKNAFKGYISCLETTYNKKTEQVHPHLHLLVWVENENYFTSSDYIDNFELSKMWARATNNLGRIVYIERVKNRNSKENKKNQKSIKSAINEVAKYTVKSTDVLFQCDFDLSELLVYNFSLAMKGRRLINYGGCCKSARKELGLTDIEKEPFSDNDTISEFTTELIYTYRFENGVYKFVDLTKNINKSILDIEKE